MKEEEVLGQRVWPTMALGFRSMGLKWEIDYSTKLARATTIGDGL